MVRMQQLAAMTMMNLAALRLPPAALPDALKFHRDAAISHQAAGLDLTRLQLTDTGLVSRP